MMCDAHDRSDDDICMHKPVQLAYYSSEVVEVPPGDRHNCTLSII